MPLHKITRVFECGRANRTVQKTIIALNLDLENAYEVSETRREDDEENWVKWGLLDLPNGTGA